MADTPRISSFLSSSLDGPKENTATPLQLPLPTNKKDTFSIFLKKKESPGVALNSILEEEMNESIFDLPSAKKVNAIKVPTSNESTQTAEAEIESHQEALLPSQNFSQPPRRIQRASYKENSILLTDTIESNKTVEEATASQKTHLYITKTALIKNNVELTVVLPLDAETVERQPVPQRAIAPQQHTEQDFVEEIKTDLSSGPKEKTLRKLPTKNTENIVIDHINIGYLPQSTANQQDAPAMPPSAKVSATTQNVYEMATQIATEEPVANILRPRLNTIAEFTAKEQIVTSQDSRPSLAMSLQIEKPVPSLSSPLPPNYVDKETLADTSDEYTEPLPILKSNKTMPRNESKNEQAQTDRGSFSFEKSHKKESIEEYTPKEELRVEMHSIATQSEQIAAVAPEPAKTYVAPQTKVIIQQIVDYMVREIVRIETPDSQQTVITLRQPPLFDGATVTLTTVSNAPKQYNIAFNDLSPRAQELLQQNTSEFKAQMAEKNITIHQMQLSHQPQSNDFSSFAQQDRQQSQQQGQGQQQSSSGGKQEPEQQQGQQQQKRQDKPFQQLTDGEE